MAGTRNALAIDFAYQTTLPAKPQSPVKLVWEKAAEENGPFLTRMQRQYVAQKAMLAKIEMVEITPHRSNLDQRPYMHPVFKA